MVGSKINSRISRQLSQLALVQSLAKNQTYYFRAHASNSQGEDWADATASFVTENKLDFNYGKITFDTTKVPGAILPAVPELAQLSLKTGLHPQVILLALRRQNTHLIQ